ncbi:PREDICTED: uncharacterized protein LOC108763338 [Trachymyrmex cornetzi]|uniref:uncharacterized protein LOC108763338 n=1 Tax=Trachymyrmex cornetzi TaxID=471704 RepID=UPI00084F25FB|nr:PREDICTED: uncharacterized protein LOC108763338 [Trachymyrmex cornetzi]
MNLQDIEKYYINLDYEELKSKKSLGINLIASDTIKVTAKSKSHLSLFLSSLIPFYNCRFEKTVLILENHMPLFKSICNHTDVPEAIVTYINYYRINIYKPITAEKVKQEIIWTLILTLLNFCARDDVQYFLETCIITNSLADNNLYNKYKELLSYQTIEIILLDDSDLYAVIKYLKISENSRNLSKIWVLESIKCNFLSLVYKTFSNFTDVIRVFKSKQELLTPPISYEINVTSIWSEDIAAAKNLAASLDRNIVLINTLDIYETMIVMPYIEIFKIPLCNLDFNEEHCIVNMIKPICSKKRPVPAKPIYNYMFYDGTWQKPVQNTYWLHNNTNILRASATKEDISRCFLSAKKGFKIWSELSTESRTQILSKFVFLLEHISKPELSEIVLKWIQFPHWYKNSLQPQSGRSLVTRIRKPKGVITLMEKRETNLFRKLTQSLIIGNSAVVICTANSCNIIRYCDLFLLSGIPPGVINVLTCENIKPLNELCHDARDLNEIYYQFTLSKQVATMI